jgi:hypothetical protein
MGDISVSEKHTAYTFKVKVSQVGKRAGNLGEIREISQGVQELGPISDRTGEPEKDIYTGALWCVCGGGAYQLTDSLIDHSFCLP